KASEERSKSSRRYADGEFAQSETDCVRVKRVRVRMRKGCGSGEILRCTQDDNGGVSSLECGACVAGNPGWQRVLRGTSTRKCERRIATGENPRGFVLQFAATGEHGGIRGLAGVCAEAGEGRGIEAHSHGSRSGVGDYGSGTAGHVRPAGRTGRNTCPTGE